MVRIKASVTRKKGRKRVFRLTKGFYGQKKNRWVQAVKAAARAMKYSTRDRKARARNFRSLWIIRITAACEQNGISYSRFIKGLKEAKIGLNRKMLSEIALDAPAVFSQIVAAAEKALPAKVTRKKVAAS